MELVYTLEWETETQKKSIFLAGPCQRDNKPTVWRQRAIDILRQNGFDGVVFIPEHRSTIVSPEWTYSRQVSWEIEHLHKADVILIWVPRTDELPCFTTNIEFGEWLNSGKIVVGAPKDAAKTDYMQERCSRLRIPWHTALEACVKDAMTLVLEKETSRVFFTSDTHFNQARTLELSRRPMKSVEEMNWALVKNWNTVVGKDDIVYHLGDFGDAFFIKFLAGKQIYFLPGNYDSEDIIKTLRYDPRVNIIATNDLIMIDGQEFNMVHAPEDANDPTKFYLFGHIHQTQMIKRNGLNVGTDCHNFTPISKTDVLFYKAAVEKHYDQNVFECFLGDKVF